MDRYIRDNLLKKKKIAKDLLKKRWDKLSSCAANKRMDTHLVRSRHTTSCPTFVNFNAPSHGLSCGYGRKGKDAMKGFFVVEYYLFSLLLSSK